MPLAFPILYIRAGQIYFGSRSQLIRNQFFLISCRHLELHVWGARPLKIESGQVEIKGNLHLGCQAHSVQRMPFPMRVIYPSVSQLQALK